MWALVNSSGLQPASLVLCNVSAADGGGMTPIKSSVQATSGQPCPDSGTVNSTDAPAWYVINNVNQAANVIAPTRATDSRSGANSCYVLTDRGTFDYLASGHRSGRASRSPTSRSSPVTTARRLPAAPTS